MKHSIIKATSMSTFPPSWIAKLFGRKWVFIYENEGGIYGVVFRGVVYDIGHIKPENGVIKLPKGYKTKHILELIS